MSDKEIIRQMQKHLYDYEETLDYSFYHGYDKEFINETKFLIDFSLINIILNFKKNYSVYHVLDTLNMFNYELHIEILMIALLRLNANILRNDLLYNIKNKIFRHPRCSHSKYPVNSVIKFFYQNSKVIVFLCDDCKKFIEYYKNYHYENELQNLLYYKSFHPLNYCTYM